MRQPCAAGCDLIKCKASCLASFPSVVTTDLQHTCIPAAVTMLLLALQSDTKVNFIISLILDTCMAMMYIDV